MNAAEPAAGVVPTTDYCRYCWMCRHVCPVGHVTRRETLTPHGWALTIASVGRGTLAWNAETADVLYKCADCGMCQTHCVTSQPLPDAIAAARAEVVAAGAAPAIVHELDGKLRRWGNPYGERGAAGAQESGGVRVFVGDAGAHLGPRAVAAALALLEAAGVEAAPIGAGRSTGLLASSLGLPETARTLGRAVIDEVEAAGCREVLVLAPGDRYAFERLYRERLGLEWPAPVNVREVGALLAGALASGRLRFRQENAPPYAYHDPCHAPRIGRDQAPVRALLAAALGEASARHLFWREHRAHPCGATGGLEFTQPEIARQLAEARLADAAAAGAVWLVTEDPLCAHHLRASRTAGPEVLGLYELLADRLAP